MAKVYDEIDLLTHAHSDSTIHVTIVSHPLVRAALLTSATQKVQIGTFD